VVSGGSRIVVPRRPIELPAAVNGSTPADAGHDEGEDSSPFDVPAFLRRQEG